MANRNAPPEITVTIPVTHPIFRALGGDQFTAAVNDIADRARKARAMIGLEDPQTRRLMAAYQSAASGSSAKSELWQQLKARGVQYFTGMVDMADADHDPFAALVEPVIGRA